MTDMKIYKLFIGILLGFFALETNTSVAQNGDQILDGIGETGLISRYTFKEDAKDWSRNNLHGAIQGTDFKFVKDELFGNVLSLNGSNDTYISLPAESVTGEQTLSITGWIYLRSAKRDRKSVV